MSNISNVSNMSNISNISNVSNSFKNNFSNILDPYKNIIIQYFNFNFNYNYNYLYVYPGKDIDITYVLYMLYTSFMWSIIFSILPVLTIKYKSVLSYKYGLIDICNILGALIGFMVYGTYTHMTLNIISGIILNLSFIILFKNKIIRINIVNYILNTSIASSSLIVGLFVIHNHILHILNQ